MATIEKIARFDEGKFVFPDRKGGKSNIWPAQEQVITKANLIVNKILTTGHNLSKLSKNWFSRLNTHTKQMKNGTSSQIYI